MELDWHILSNMNILIQTCSCNQTTETDCSLSLTCKGWGCRFLTTPFEDIPKSTKDKAKLFVKVYREAKQKGVLECPHYRPLFIDEVIDSIKAPIKQVN